MNFKEHFTNNNGINIEYLDNEVKTQKTPILICPGLSECANDYMELMSTISDRRCIALSFRGRGKSDDSNTDYTLESHVSDIEAVVNHIKLKDFIIMGVSRGVSYELGYAISNNELLKGVIIDEYPPEHKMMPSGWAKGAMEFYNEHCEHISISEKTLEGIEIDSVYVDFRKDLKNITCPTLIIKGELEDSLLSIEDINDCINNLGSLSTRVERFNKSGHDIQSNEFDKLSKVVNEFLNYVDAY